MTIDPKRIPLMEVRRGCRDVVGPFPRPTTHPGDRQRLVQRGSCPRHRPYEPDPGWPRFDFNRRVDLCYCCGIPSVPIEAYCREARIHVDPLDRFREMCAYLDDRGPSGSTEERAGSR